MTLIGGTLSAFAAVVATWGLAHLTLHNLPTTAGRLSLILLLCLAALLGFLAGSAICRRAAHDRDRLGLFAGLAGGVAGGALGFAYAVTITAAYLSTYSTWPQDRLDQVLVLLSYPIFGALGSCIGGFVGWLFGLLFGGVLKFAPQGR